MYQIQLVESNENTMIYDQSQMSSPSTVEPKCSLQINEAGSLSFTLLPGHSLYNVLEPMASFIRALDDGEEIFYGRVIQRSEPKLKGRVSFTCEGALSFLLDSEVTPYGKDRNGNQITRTLTAEAFFRWCIDQHNADVNDPRRQFTVGIVDAARKDKQNEYSISNYSQTKSVIESNILNVYGGFIRIRPIDNGGHYIDWVENYGSLNPQPITIGTNVEDITHQKDGSSMFTVLRPVGKDGLTLTEKTIDLYSQEDMARYGRIVKSIEFNGADTEAKLRSEANEYKDRIQKTLFTNSSIQFVDMHYLDGTTPKIRMGDRFTNIVGLEGSEMVADSLELNFEHPQNDSLELKNRKSLDPDLTPEGNKHSSKGKSYSRSSKATAAQHFKWIQEQGELLSITANQVQMHGTSLEMQYQQILTTADNIAQLSRRQNSLETDMEGYELALNGINFRVQTIEGAGVIQNDQFISTLSGIFEIWRDSQNNIVGVHLKDGADISVDDHNGGTITVGSRINSVTQKVNDHDTYIEEYQGSALWTQRNQIVGVCGEYEVETEMVLDPLTNRYVERKTLVVKSGGGMKIRKEGVEYGLYMTNDGGDTVLTGGLMVQKINQQTTTKIRGDRVEIAASDITLVGNTTLDSVVGHWSEESFTYTDEDGEEQTGHRLVYTAEGGMRVRRLDDEGMQTEYGVYDDGNLTGGVLVTKINGQTTTSIRGDKILIGNISGNDLDTWAADAEGLIAARATIGQLSAAIARISTIESDYITTQNIAATIGNINLLNVSAIAGKNANAYAAFDSYSGNHYNVNMGSAGGQALPSKDLCNGIYELQIVPPSAGSNDYTLQKKSIKDSNWSNVGTFSRATELTGTWSSGELTVAASPQGNEFKRMLLSDTRQNQDGTTYTPGSNKWRVPILAKWNQDNYGNYQNSESTGSYIYVDATDNYNAGRNAISLVGPNWDSNNYAYGYGGNYYPSARTITVRTSGKDTEESKDQYVGLEQDGTFNVSHKKKVYIVTAASNGTRMAGIEVDATSEYNAGRLAVTVEDASYWSWNSINGNPTASRTLTVETSGRGTEDSKSLEFHLTQDSSFSNHKKKVYMRTVSTSGIAYAQVEVDASGEYSDGETNGIAIGKTAVTIQDVSYWTWSSYSGSTVPSSRTLTVTTSGRGTEDSKSLGFYLIQDSNWSSHKKKVYMKTGSTSGNTYAQIEVDATSEWYDGWDNGYASAPSPSQTTIDEHYGRSYNGGNAGTMIEAYAHATDGISSTSHTLYLYLDCGTGYFHVRKDNYSGTIIGRVQVPGLTNVGMSTTNPSTYDDIVTINKNTTKAITFKVGGRSYTIKTSIV